jgi:hypothetical protein
MRITWIKVDLDRLTLRLWKSQGTWLGGFELRQWLAARGYEWGGGGWYFCRDGPCDLDADEILETCVRVTHDNITFVERAGPPDQHSSGTAAQS